MKDFDLQPTLKSNLLYIRPLTLEDFESLYAVASDPLIWEQHPCPTRYQRNVFRGFFDEAIRSRGALAVFDTQTGALIGSSRYYELSFEKREVVIGYTFLKRDYWGGQYNRELKRLMMDHAFRWVDTVLFHVDQSNQRSQKAMKKIGGEKMGLFERKPDPNGQVRTAWIYAIRKGEFETENRSGVESTCASHGVIGVLPN